jgi:hypothetical protein
LRTKFNGPLLPDSRRPYKRKGPGAYRGLSFTVPGGRVALSIDYWGVVVDRSGDARSWRDAFATPRDDTKDVGRRVAAVEHDGLFDAASAEPEDSVADDRSPSRVDDVHDFAAGSFAARKDGPDRRCRDTEDLLDSGARRTVRSEMCMKGHRR